jgi:hypothetical protein
MQRRTPTSRSRRHRDRTAICRPRVPPLEFRPAVVRNHRCRCIGYHLARSHRCPLVRRACSHLARTRRRCRRRWKRSSTMSRRPCQRSIGPTILATRPSRAVAPCRDITLPRGHSPPRSPKSASDAGFCNFFWTFFFSNVSGSVFYVQ